MRKTSVIIFWGALWGITEATVGHLLHILALPIGWLVWFPIAFGFMVLAYQQTKRPVAIFCTALVAAAIKLIDLMMPVRIDYVINPAVSIIIEGLAVLTACRFFGNYFGSIRLISVTSILWRLLYSGYILCMPLSWVQISPLKGVESFLRFLLLESTVNSLIIIGIAKLAITLKSKRLDVICNPHPVLAGTMLAIACLIQWRL